MQPDDLSRPRFARWPVVGVAAMVAIVLVAVSTRYGYHRDELYFLTAGHHLAWGYPDEPPFIAVAARLLSALAPGSLLVLRLPSALVAGSVVALTGVLAREFGGDRTAQTLAAGSMALSAFLLGTGHLFHPTTFDILVWVALLWLFVRLLRTGDDRLWIGIGLVTGAGLLNDNLAVFLVGAFVIGILVTGPRRTLTTPWPWLGGVIAAAIWTPYLVWQAQHGWPQLDVARTIAGGGSGSSAPRALFVPFQFALVSPWLAPVWITGLVRLFRDARLQWARSLGWTYVVLAVLFLVIGGKPYYLAGMFPVLLGVGAQPVAEWVRRGRRPLRRAALGTAFVVSAPGLLVALPILPVGTLHRTPIVDLNYDLGETVGWPTYVRQIAGVLHGLPSDEQTTTALVTSNYGEAGAIDRFGPRYELPNAFSGHMGYWYWGPPPRSTKTVVAVGFSRAELAPWFADVHLATRLRNPYDVANDEQHQAVWICRRPRASREVLWKALRVF